MNNIYENVEEYTWNKKHKILIVFDDMNAVCLAQKKGLVTELFIRGRKVNIFLVFIMQRYFKVPKCVRLNTIHFLIIKFPNKREL